MPITLTWEQQKECVRRVEYGYRFQRKAMEARGASDAEIQAHAANFSNEWYAEVLLPGGF